MKAFFFNNHLIDAEKIFAVGIEKNRNKEWYFRVLSTGGTIIAGSDTYKTIEEARSVLKKGALGLGIDLQFDRPADVNIDGKDINNATN